MSQAVNIHGKALPSSFLLLLLAHLAQRSLTDNQYCYPGIIPTLSLDDSNRKDEILIAQIQSEQGDKRFHYSSCEWLLEMKSQPDEAARQLVIQGLPMAEGNGESRNSAKAEVTSTLGIMERIQAGSFFIYPLVQRETFRIKFSWEVDAAAVNRTAMNVRVMVPIPKVCSQDMLSFRGNCYAVSSFHQNVTAAMSSIKGDAQLASFTSMAEISEFIAANSARLNEFPYRRILGLGQAVRLGMFHSAADAALLAVVRSDSGCGLQPVLNSTAFIVAGRVTGPCASLHVAEPDRAVVEFGDCSRPMLSLLSFPETARSVPTSAHCNGSELVRRVAQLESLEAAAVIPYLETSKEPRHSAPQTLIATCASVGGIILLAAAIAVLFLTRRRCRRQSKSIYLSGLNLGERAHAGSEDGGIPMEAVAAGEKPLLKIDNENCVV